MHNISLAPTASLRPSCAAVIHWADEVTWDIQSERIQWKLFVVANLSGWRPTLFWNWLTMALSQWYHSVVKTGNSHWIWWIPCLKHLEVFLTSRGWIKKFEPSLALHGECLLKWLMVNLHSNHGKLGHCSTLPWWSVTFGASWVSSLKATKLAGTLS